MAKKIKAYIKLIIKAGMANPSPPVGPALGQHAVPIMEFCNQFNDRTKDKEKGTPLPVEITVFEDRSFTFIVKTPPASVMLKKKAGLEKASSTPSKEVVAKLTQEDIKAIATEKFVDMNASTIETAMKSIAGTARSMGIEVEANAE